MYIFETDGDYVNFNGGGGLWRLARASNCIAWRYDETGDLFFDVYDQQYIVKAENISDVVIDSTPLAAASDFPDAITAVFTGIGSGGGSSYLVYTALLTQTGTDVPVATVLGNTLGGTVVWTRDSEGNYSATLAGVFTLNKTVMPPFGNNQYVLGGIFNTTPFDYSYALERASADVVNLFVYDNTGAAADISEALGGRSIFIEIRVYP